MKISFLGIFVLLLVAFIACNATETTPSESAVEDIDVEATISAGIQATRDAEESATSTREFEPSNTPLPTEAVVPAPEQVPTDTPTPTLAPQPTPTPAPFVEPTATVLPTTVPTHTPSPTFPPPVSVISPSPTAVSQPEPTTPLDEREWSYTVCQDIMDFAMDNAQDVSQPIAIVMIEQVPDTDHQIFCRALMKVGDTPLDGMSFYLNNTDELVMELFGIQDWSCDFLLPKILEFNESLVKGTTENEILKVYDVEQLRRVSDKLVCGGFARTSQGETNLEFSIEQDIDGEFFWGYTFVENLSRHSEADELLVESVFNCLTSNQEIWELLFGTELESFLYYYDYDTFSEEVFNIWNSQPGVTDVELKELFEQFLEFCSS